MEITFGTMSSALAAIEQLYASGNLSVESIFDIVAKTSAGFDDAPFDAVYLLYNGKEWVDDINPDQSYATWDLVNSMVQGGGGKVLSVNESAAGQLLNNGQFASFLRLAIENTIDPSLPLDVREDLIEEKFQFIKSAKVENLDALSEGEKWIRDGSSGSLWDLVSKKYIQENEGDFRMIMQNTPDPLSVFVKTEIDAFLEHPGSRSTLNGMSKQDLIAMDGYWANREKLIDLITVQSYSYATLTDLRKGNVGSYLSFDFSSSDAVKSSMQNLPENKLADLVDRVNALPSDFRNKIIGAGDNLVDYLDNASEISVKAMAGIGAMLGTTFLIASGLKINQQVQEGDNEGAINSLKDLLISLTAESIVEAGVAVVAAPVFAAIEGAAISFGLKYTLRLTLGVGLGLIFGDKVEDFLQLMRDKNENGRIDIADKLAGLLFGEGTTQISVQKDIAGGETLAFEYFADPDKIFELAKNDVSWRYSLRELIPFVLTDLDYEKFNEDASLELYNPLTGDGVLSEDYLRDRAYALYAFTKYWNQNESDGQWSSQPLIEYAGSNILFSLMHIYLKTQTGETLNLPFLAQWGDLVITDASLGEDQQLIKDGWDLGIVEPNYLRFGHESIDSLNGGGKDDRLYGMEGNDVLYGYGGNDYLEGGTGGDFLHGGEGDDYLAGMSGDDHLYGEAGDDYLAGGNGADKFYFNTGDGHDTIVDFTTGDELYINGQRITSIERVSDGVDVFTDGTNQYIYSPESGLLIKVEGGESDTIRINNWTPVGSNFGISVSETTRPQTTTPDSGVFVVGSGIVEGDYDIHHAAIMRDSDTYNQAAINQSSIQYDASLYVSTDNDSYLGFAFERFEGGSRNDQLIGGDAADWLVGGSGDDTIQGGSAILLNGFNVLEGGLGSDIIKGGEQSDWIFGNSWQKVDIFLVPLENYVSDDANGNDYLIGAGGNDNISGDEGDDYIDGGIGEDFIGGGQGADVITGGAGRDQIWADSNLDVHYTYAENGVDVIGMHPAVIYETEQKEGVRYDDTVAGGDGDDLIFGELGNDVISGDGGDDHIYGDREITFEQSPVVYGNSVTDDQDWFVTLDQSLHGDDRLFGGEGNDQITGGGGKDYISGDEGNDRIWGDDPRMFGEFQSDDTIFGGSGEDLIIGGGGDDTIDGGSDNDTIYGDDANMYGESVSVIDASYHGDDFISGGDGADIIVGGGGADTILGGSGADNIMGDLRRFAGGAVESMSALYQRGDFIDGGEGNDTIWGDGGDDTLIGNVGDDILDGGTGADTLMGGAGSDSLWGGAGNDTLIGGANADFLDGQEGDDTYVFLGGDGVDSITDTQGRHTLVLQNASRAQDVNVQQGTSNTVIWVGADTQNSIVMSNASFSRLARIQLSDGTYASNILMKVESGVQSVSTPILSSLVVLQPNTTDLTINNDNESSHSVIVSNNNQRIESGWGYSRDAVGTAVRHDPDGMIPNVIWSGPGFADVVIMPDANNDGMPDGIYGISTGIGSGSESGFGFNRSDAFTTDIEPVYIDGDAADNYFGGNSRDNILQGFAGNDRLYSYEGNNLFDGGVGADVMSGGGGNDAYYLDGGVQGNTVWQADVASDSSGNDRYYVAGSSGVNVVTDRAGEQFGVLDDVADKLYLSDVLLSDVTFSRPSGTSDLRISLAGAEEFVTVKYFFVDWIDGVFAVDTIEFSDGVTIGSDYFFENFQEMLVGDGDDIVYSGYQQSLDRVINTGAGNDVVYLRGEEGGININTGDGNDEVRVALSYRESTSIIALGAGDDKLLEGEGAYIWSLGWGWAEILTPWLYGSVTYRMSSNDGHDYIGLARPKSADEVYTLELDGSVSAEDVNFRLQTTEYADLELLIEFGDASITFADRWVNDLDPIWQVFYGNNQWALSQIVFADGTTWDINDIQSRIHSTTEHDNVLNGSVYEDDLFGADGNDLIYGREGNDILRGGNGDDALYGGADNDLYVVDGVGTDLIIDWEGDNRVELSGNTLSTANKVADNHYVDSFGNSYRIIAANQITGDYYNDLDVVFRRDNYGDPQEIEFGDTNLLVLNGDARVIIANWNAETNNFGIQLIDEIVMPPNSEPVAQADTVHVNYAGTIVIGIADLLANDSDVDGDALQIQSLQNISNGVATLDLANGVVVVTDVVDRTTPVTFDYVVSDGKSSSVGHVSVDIHNAPVAADDHLSVTYAETITIAFSELLGNDSDLDGDALVIESISNVVGGQVILDLAQNRLLISSVVDPQVPVSFDYTVSDGTQSSTASAVIDLVIPNTAPVAQADSVQVNYAEPLIIAIADLLANDSDVDGDVLQLQSLQNVSNGVATLDLVNGLVVITDVADPFAPVTFSYTVSDGEHTASTDTLIELLNYVPEGALAGTSGDETITGNMWNNNVFLSDAGNDTMQGGTVADTFLVYGNNNGFDRYFGNYGFDRILGSVGDDVIGVSVYGQPNVFSLVYAVEQIDGRGGYDVIQGNASANYMNFRNTELIGIELIDGGAGNDRIFGSQGDDVIRGGTGNDQINGSAGNDIIQFSLGDGSDTVINSGSVETDHDTLQFGAGIDHDQIWLGQSGSDLDIYLLGSNDKIKISQWFGADSSYRLEAIEAGDFVLDEGKVDQLVVAMASFGVVNAANPSFTTGQQSQVDLLLADAWRPQV